MISKYKVNMPGPYHIKKGIPCQDAYCIRETSTGVVIAAVADGLGSEKYSDKGAKIASNFVVTYCLENYRDEMTDEEIVALLRRAYAKAYAQVQTIANRDGNEVDQYDCTLCTVIYDGRNVFYGQSGDSGLIVGSNDGAYYPITEQQRDEDGNVYPLCFGPEYWDFGRVEGNVVSVMLMTDGVWEQACPPIMKYEQQPINVGFVEMFMNNYGLSTSEVKCLEREANRYMRVFPPERLDDDKTIVVLINSDARPLRREDAYYESPDWDRLVRECDERMHEMYKDSSDETGEDASEPPSMSEVHIPIDLSKAGKVVQTLVNKVDGILMPKSKSAPEEVKKKTSKTIHIDIRV